MFPPVGLAFLKRRQGFTLAELLIALAILGVIATFTIPKILSAQQEQKFNAIGKEVASMVSASYQTYKLNNQLSASTGATNLTPYMNYVRVDTTSDIDDEPGGGTVSCSEANRECLLLHNGGILYYRTAGHSFGGTATTNVIYFQVDPDGVADGSPTGKGKSLVLFLTYAGRLTTWAGIASGTVSSDENWGAPEPSFVPSWFSW